MARGGSNEVEIVVRTKDETGATGAKIKRQLIRQGEESGKGFSRSFQTGAKSGLASLGGMAKLLGLGLLGAAGGAAALGAGALVLGPKLAAASARLKDLDAKAKAVFVDQLPAVRRWAEANKRAFGLTARETIGLAANMADLLKPMGFSSREAAKMSLKLLDLSGALSKWTGGTRSAAEVSEILSAALLGERDGLKQLGISISEADVQARLAEKGQTKLTGAARAQAEAVATQELIYEKSTDAQKAWAEGGKKAAEAQKGLSTTIGELKEKIVTALTPAIQAAARWLSVNIPIALQASKEWWDKNKASVKELADTLTVFFVPAADGAATSTEKVRTMAERTRSVLGDILEPVLRVGQAFLQLGIAAGITRRAFIDMGIAILTTMNALTLGTNPRIREFINQLQTMRTEGETQLNRLREQIAVLQDAIDQLHGKDIHFRLMWQTVGHPPPGQSLPGGRGGLQHGTSHWRGGPTIVGERGPELVDLPRGSRVIPNHRIGGGAGGVVRLEIHSGGSRLDDLLVELLRKSIRVKGGNVQAVLGS